MSAASTLGMFPPPESLNSARIERMKPPMPCSVNEGSIEGVILSIEALFNDSGGGNTPRVLAASNGLPTHCAGNAATPRIAMWRCRCATERRPWRANLTHRAAGRAETTACRRAFLVGERSGG